MNSVVRHKRRLSDVDSAPYSLKQPRCIPESNDATLGITNTTAQKKLTNGDYTVGWVAALAIERAAAEAMLDGHHQKLPKAPGDTNNYTFGEIGGHNVVIASLPHDGYGTVNAATVAGNMHRTFPSLEVFLMVGIAGGAPAVDDVRLGDVVVSTKLIQYDLGRALGEDRFETTAIPLRPSQELRMTVAALQARHEVEPSRIPDILRRIAKQNPYMERYTSRESLQDLLFEGTYEHPVSESTCNRCDQSRLVKRIPRCGNDPMIHYGVIASGDQVIKSATIRDKLARRFEALCFEMEGAGFIESLQCLVIRSICDYADSHKNKQWQRYAAATAAAYTKELLSEMPILESQASKIVLSKEQKKDIMNWLSFPSMYSRTWNIENAQNKTCKWILQHPTYSAWLDPEEYDQTHGFLWIRGKPGAGKSTLMKFISTHASMKDHTVVSFFFNARGDGLEKSVEGMYRSLLYQLLDKIPDLQLLHYLYPQYLAYKDRFEWTIGFLRELFSKAIVELGQQELICFIDALDECDVSQVRGMVKHFQNLGILASETKLRLFICFSSRHYPTISVTTGLTFVLEDQYGHGKDLEEYVDQELNVVGEEDALEIKTALLKKAAGVFLWVVLVVRILNEDCLGGRMFGLKARLNEIPSELHALFRDILLKDDKNGADLLLSIQWILYAKRPLEPEEYYWAMVAGLNPDKGSMIEWNREKTTIDKINQFVLSSSKGLAEVIESTRPIVQFIHESVRDFLIKDGGIYELWPDLKLDFETLSHDRLKNCCYTRVKAASSDIGNNNHVGRRYFGKHPFLQYAIKGVLYHADLAAARASQQDFLRTFDLRAWILLHNIPNYIKKGSYTLSANIFYVLADQGCARLIDIAVALCGPMVHVYGEEHKYPLFAALEKGHNEAANAILRAGTSRISGDNFLQQLPSNCETLVIDNHTPLTLAIKAGNMKAVQFLLDHGITPNTADPNGRVPLILALSKGLDQIARLLIKEGAENNSKDENDETPLQIASTSESLETIQLLLDKGAKPNPRNKAGDTPLHIILSKSGSQEIVQLLLDKGADPNIQNNNGDTPLHIASRSRPSETIQLLLDKGADPNLKDKNGDAPLHTASRFGSLKKVQQLLDKGAEPNPRTKDDETPLHIASQHGFLKIVQLLLDKGAKVDSKNKYGETPLHIASRNGFLEIILLLLENGAEPNPRNKANVTPLHITSQHGFLKIVQLLLNKGAKVDSKNKYGETPLHIASRSRSLALIQLLLDKGAELEPKDNDGNTPLHIACIFRSLKTIQLLLDQGAEVNSRNKVSETPLNFASKRGHWETVQLLLDKGADAITTCNDGITPLHSAVDLGCSRVVKLLLERGADVNMIKINDMARLRHVDKERYKKLVELLQTNSTTKAKSLELGRIFES